jgi:hypothetical protein
VVAEPPVTSTIEACPASGVDPDRVAPRVVQMSHRFSALWMLTAK